MKTLIIALSLLVAVPASAVTQTVKQANLLRYLQRSTANATQAQSFLTGAVLVYQYDTYAELAAATPTEGVIGYAIDTNAWYLRSGASWIGVNTTGALTGANGGSIANASDTVWTFAEANEDLTLTFSANLVTFASTTSATFTLTPATTITGDLTLNGGAGGLTFVGAASSIVVPNNSATALVIGGSGIPNIVTLDTQTGVEKLMITGTTTATALHIDVGTSLFDEKVTIGAGAGALTLTGASASFLLKDATSDSLDIGSAGRTNLLRFDTTDNAEKMIVSGTTATTAFQVAVGEASFVEGVTAPVMATSSDKIRFCGNGANGNTANYFKPVLSTDYATDMSFGAAACDANDSTTLTTADLVWGPFAYKAVSMVCVIAGDAGSNDAVTFQLYDDAGAVSGMACSVTLAGATSQQCVVRDASPAMIAVSSQITVGVVGVDDNESAQDAECDVIVNF